MIKELGFKQIRFNSLVAPFTNHHFDYIDNLGELWYPLTTKKIPSIRSPFQNCKMKVCSYPPQSRFFP